MIQQETQNKRRRGRLSREIKDTFLVPGSAEERYIKEVIAEVCYRNPGVLIKMSPRKEAVAIVPEVWVR